MVAMRPLDLLPPRCATASAGGGRSHPDRHRRMQKSEAGSETPRRADESTVFTFHLIAQERR